MTRLLVCSIVLLAGLVASEAHRIIGGENTSVEVYPSVVQVESLVGITWSQTCAASILTSTHVLTAAQCSSGLLFSRRFRRVRAGSSDRGTGGETSGVITVTNHPNFGQKRFDSDITVWRIEPLTYSPVIQQGSIVASGITFPAYSRVVKVGWGVTGEDSESAENLQAVSSVVIDSEACSTRFEEAEVSVEITSNIICTGDEDLSCAGDAGGPVFYDNIIIGVITSAQGCGNGTLPGLNTAVSSFSDWIVAMAV